MVIKCCKDCVAPKRHRACWDHCPEYLAEKEQYEKQKEQECFNRKIGCDIYQQRADRVTKAMRRLGRRGFNYG